jgi:hypothetical protein
MQDERSQQVIQRFFEVLQTLKEKKVIRGINTFCVKYDINRRNLWQLQQNPERDILKLSWLTALVYDYFVSPDWLLTGRGRMFTKSIENIKE